MFSKGSQLLKNETTVVLLTFMEDCWQIPEILQEVFYWTSSSLKDALHRNSWLNSSDVVLFNKEFNEKDINLFRWTKVCFFNIDECTPLVVRVGRFFPSAAWLRLSAAAGTYITGTFYCSQKACLSFFQPLVTCFKRNYIINISKQYTNLIFTVFCQAEYIISFFTLPID